VFKTVWFIYAYMHWRDDVTGTPLCMVEGKSSV